MSILVNCSNCGAEIYKFPSLIKKSRNLFCGNKCRIEHSKGKGIGKDNPNFGKKWDAERKKRQSEIIKSKVDDTYRKKCSSGMLGKKVSDESKIKRKETRLGKYGKFNPDIFLSEEARRKIGEKSSSKFTEDFKEKMYRTMVERGYWIDKKNKEPYFFYRDLSNWNCNVLIYKVKGSDLINEIGFYSTENRNGLVRDHRYCRRDGFDNLVFPEILRHPFNCELISHPDNIRKQQSKNIESSSISLSDLLNGIKEYHFEYHEQDLCLERINQYEMGLRYSKNLYLPK